MSFKHLSASTALSVIATFGLIACGGGGGSSSTATVTAPPTPPADTSAPSVTFSPTTLTVASGETGTSTVSATDNVGVTSGPTVSCTNGGSFSGGVFTAPGVTADMTSICTATAGDAAGNSGEATLTVTISAPIPDTADPVLTFDPVSLTVVSGGTASAALTATDNVAIVTGPTVNCTNGGSFADNVFTAPTVSTNTTSVCTATASDAAGNSNEATLTVSVTPVVSGFFQNISDTIVIGSVLSLLDIPTDPSTLVGVTRNAAGAVSTFAATASGTGVYDDPIVTAQPTLGTVVTPPLDILFADIDGLDDGIDDLIFFDETNDEIVGVPLNADNTFGLPITQSVPNGCDIGRGSATRFVGGGGTDPTRDDILVGTTNGLFYVSAGFANDGINTSGFAAPIPLVNSGNFCSLIVAPTGIGDTAYAVYDPATRIISGFEGENSDAASYTEEFTADLSNVMDANLTPLLFEGTSSIARIDTIVTVFDDTQQAGSIVVISDVGVIPDTTVLNIDIQSPTDILIISRSLSEDVLLVSPTSEFAVYIRDANRSTRTVELIQIGLGFDQVEFAAGAVAFASSTQDNIVIRTLQ